MEVQNTQSSGGQRFQSHKNEKLPSLSYPWAFGILTRLGWQEGTALPGDNRKEDKRDLVPRLITPLQVVRRPKRAGIGYDTKSEKTEDSFWNTDLVEDNEISSLANRLAGFTIDNPGNQPQYDTFGRFRISYGVIVGISIQLRMFGGDYKTKSCQTALLEVYFKHSIQSQENQFRKIRFHL
jgi:hypothetical protein